MDREDLAKGMLARGCVRRDESDSYYPSHLLRCDCIDHELAAASSSEKIDEPVKLFGAALSWHVKNDRKCPLTFVLGKDAEGHWKKSLHAIQMLQPKDVDIDLQVDFSPGPDMCDVDLSSHSWVKEMQNLARWKLPQSACQLAAGAAIDAFAWYRSVTGGEWSGRLDGLQVCTLSTDGSTLTFKVGEPGSRGIDSGVRLAFRNIAAGHEALFGPLSDGQLELGPGDEDRAVKILRELSLSDIASKGSKEHRLESRVLRGDVILKTKDGPLQVVSHSFQFPTRWWPHGRARYVDVMSRQGAVPWVVELKIGHSQGSYYRDGIVQAALYRQYILRSPGLDEWFEDKGLRRQDCRAALVIPPLRGGDAAGLRDDHRAVADLLGVDLIESVDAET